MENTQWLQKKICLIKKCNKGIARSLLILPFLMWQKVLNQEDHFQAIDIIIDKNLIIKFQQEARLCRKKIQIKFLDLMRIMRKSRVLIVNLKVLCQEEVSKV